MKLTSSLAILCALLSGCGPAQVWYKPGGSLALRSSDLLHCRVESLAQAPVATQIRQWPPTYIPTRRYCDAAGRCVTDGGFFAPGEVYSVDVNAGLRRDLEARCMAQRGYASVELPRCPTGETDPRGTPAEPAETMPSLTGSSCAQRDDTGDWVILDRGA